LTYLINFPLFIFLFFPFHKNFHSEIVFTTKFDTIFQLFKQIFQLWLTLCIEKYENYFSFQLVCEVYTKIIQTTEEIGWCWRLLKKNWESEKKKISFSLLPFHIQNSKFSLLSHWFILGEITFSFAFYTAWIFCLVSQFYSRPAEELYIFLNNKHVAPSQENSKILCKHIFFFFLQPVHVDFTR
jgi:hypothetical protein